MELRAAREASGKTQTQVAKEIGVTELSYQRYEYDKRIPRVDTAILIARAVNSTVEDLFGAATPDNTKQPGGNLAGGRKPKAAEGHLTARQGSRGKH